ncbi:MAG: TIM-barrel domain-containing protein [Sphingopyxis sp.]
MFTGYWSWAAMLGSLLCFVVPAAAQAQELVVANATHSLRATPISDEIVRIRITPNGATAEDASWVVAADVRARRASAQIGVHELRTARLHITVDPATLGLTVTDQAGQSIFASDAEPLRREEQGFTVRQRLEIGEHIFALGDKTGLLDRRGSSFVNWNTDSWNYSSSSDPSYKSVPFFISSGSAGGAYGILLDNSWRSWFDFGHREADVLSLGANGGPIDYYIIAGPTIAEVVRRYTDLSGRSPLPPRWVLGYQQSRWSYESEAEVRALAARLRSERIPTDVIWLDIDYQDRNRPFTINRQRFPQFRGMISDLRRDGFSLVAIADPHIAYAPDQGYAAYDSGVSGDQFLSRADGTTYIAPVWPGPSVFPDYTRAATREWWGGLLTPLVDDGIAGIWNDMNEPAIFETPTKTMPIDNIHRIAGDDFAARTATHAELHNVYGMQNTRATYDGLRRLRPDERAFVMTRASFAGGQRYAATWTGDNSSTWDHLRLSVSQTLNLGLSGFTWAGADVGGFTGGPSAELMTRWFQYAAFAPIFRDHSAKDAPRAEPWVHGAEHLAIRRRYVEERYRLMPYIYALAEASARTGDPLMRPVFYDYPALVDSPCSAPMTFTLGASLLIGGNPKPEDDVVYPVCLPAGGWYDYWTGVRVRGRAVSATEDRFTLLDVTPHLDTLPVYVRAGTILPRAPLVQSTLERPEGALELHIYPGSDCHGTLYDDDGHSMGFAHGDFARQSVTCAVDAAGRVQSISFAAREGRHHPWWSAIELVIHGGGTYQAWLGGRALAVRQVDGASRIELTDQAGPVTIALTPTS